MKKEAKKQIYDLLKTIDANNEGFVRDVFKTEPEFQDSPDVVIENPEPKSDAPAPEETIPTAERSSKTAVATAPEPAPASAHSGLTLQTLTQKILNCSRCELCNGRKSIVAGAGVPEPEVLVIGDTPDYEADLQGIPAVGKMGELLDKMLIAIKLDRKTNCYITNLIKCRPPQDREPSAQEKDSCFSFLEAQINVLKPKMILCMGRIAAQTLLDSDEPMANMHGKFYEYNKTPVMVTYHPNALLKNAELKKPAWEDLKEFRRKLDELEN